MPWANQHFEISSEGLFAFLRNAEAEGGIILTPGGQPIIQIYLIGIYVVISMRMWGGVNAFTLHGVMCRVA